MIFSVAILSVKLGPVSEEAAIIFFWMLRVSLSVLLMLMAYRYIKLGRLLSAYADKVHKASERDIDLGLPWEWRYKALSACIARYIVRGYMFWVPIDRFCPDKSFME
jgi:hypothetical protein